MKVLGWFVAVAGGLAGLATAAWVIWFDTAWTQHFDPDAGYGSDTIGIAVAGVGAAVVFVALGAGLIRGERWSRIVGIVVLALLALGAAAWALSEFVR